jgi:hypothetical protein
MQRAHKRTTLRMVCCACGERSRPVAPRSPAAPALTALEELHREGWAYRLGFHSMLTGDYAPLCPRCVAGARAAAPAPAPAG